MEPRGFPDIRFQGQLRSSQAEIAQIARQQLSEGSRNLHFVAPPGSGKTIAGLHLWAEVVRAPALVLAPNSAIQAQWATQAEMFRGDRFDVRKEISTSGRRPRLMTSLTYQSITMPAAATTSVADRAIDLWIQSLLEDEQAHSATEAEVWIADLRTHNPDYFEKRLAHYRKKIRDDDALDGRAMSLLHSSCLDTLVRLRDYGIGLLILDECHHLLGHWGRVLTEVDEYFGDPVVVGLTSTPPDREGRRPEDLERYDRFFGPVDYDMPVPAAVKDGFLAPFQDLAYFVNPTEKELKFIEQVDQQFDRLVEDLCQPGRDTGRETLIEWLQRVLSNLQLPIGQADDWQQFQSRDPNFARAAVAFLDSRGAGIPSVVPVFPAPDQTFDESLVTVLDRYTRHCLRRSPSGQDHELAQQVVDRLRMLGVQITDSGHRPCASPISRVIGYTRSKTAATTSILAKEMACLGAATRAVVIADYEKTSAITSEIKHLLDEEAGGAVAAFRSLVACGATNELDPILVTGSTVLVDADLVDRFTEASVRWLKDKAIAVELDHIDRGGFFEIDGRGSDWCPRVYVEMITDLFQRGITRCLVGTRGLLGEDWDANSINVLVDLSTVTTATTVNQLRGRSIRRDPNVPNKVANNWDVVCIAPGFTKGLDDYQRLIKKHKTLFGICDDGAIEKGVGHIHAAFTELEPELLDGSAQTLNNEMLGRVENRDAVYRQWKVGGPYSAVSLRTVEVGGLLDPRRAEIAPHGRLREWTNESLLRAIGQAVLGALRETQQLQVGELNLTHRDGGYIRVSLDDCSEEQARLFAASMRKTVSPFVSPRYVIPRFADFRRESWFGLALPDFVIRLLAKRRRTMAMLHAVPTVLATRRAVADIFQRHWNERVSPGDAIYARNEDGRQLISDAVSKGLLPNAKVHAKEVFV